MAPTGRVTRPAGSDSYWPPVGTVVPWRLHGVIVQMYDQAKRHGVEVKGTIGNTDHLRKHGGHTPWEPGKPREVVHAVDLEAPGLGDFILAICRTTEDTSFIQFMNWRGRQYDHGGNDTGPSGDWHLHFHVRGGGESRAVKLIDRYAARNAPPPEEDDMFTETDRAVLKEAGYGGANASRRTEQAVAALDAKIEVLLAASGEEVQRDAAAAARDAELLAIARAIQAGDPQVLADLLGDRLTEGFLDALGQVRLTRSEP